MSTPFAELERQLERIPIRRSESARSRATMEHDLAAAGPQWLHRGRGDRMVGNRPMMRIRLTGLRVVSGLVAVTLFVPITMMSPRPSAGAPAVTLTMARNADMLTWDPYPTGDDPSI